MMIENDTRKHESTEMMIPIVYKTYVLIQRTSHQIASKIGCMDLTDHKNTYDFKMAKLKDWASIEL